MELWDVLDENALKTGETIVRGNRLQQGEYHLVVHIWVTNAAGQILIQKRAAHLRLMPGIWSVTTGSAIAGEDSITAARRELREEIGLDAAAEDFHLIGRVRRPSSFSDVWWIQREANPAALILQESEVSAVRWTSWKEMDSMVEAGEFYDYGKAYFQMVRRALSQ